MSANNQRGTVNRQSIIISGNSGNMIGSNYGTVSQIGGGNSLVVVDGSSTTVTINGKTFTGRKIEQRNGRVFVDDCDVTDEIGKGIQAFNITVQGNVERIEGCHQVIVTGNAGKVKSQSGTVTIQGDVSGNVESMSGTISCGKVAGNVKTLSGSISRK